MVPSVTIFRPQLENSWNCKSSFFSYRFGIDLSFLLLGRPAGGSFTVEIASNRAKTTLSYGNRDASDWPDGGHYPEDYVRIFLTYSSVNYTIAYSMCRPALFRPIVGSSWISNGLLTSSRCSAR